MKDFVAQEVDLLYAESSQTEVGTQAKETVFDMLHCS